MLPAKEGVYLPVQLLSASQKGELFIKGTETICSLSNTYNLYDWFRHCMIWRMICVHLHTYLYDVLFYSVTTYVFLHDFS